ncbi:MAG: amidohydrolase family protein [Pseudomonadota bacterium]|nr:amidohydrolase family protein [Pseudomonadota bacterium]
MKRICIVSGDGHAGTRVADYRDYMPARYHGALKEVEQEERDFLLVTAGQSRFPEEALAVIDDRSAIRSGGQSGGWDPARRVREMDQEGVVAEIIHQGHQHASMPFFSITNRPRPPELRQVGAEAYHRWLAEHMAATGGRAFGVADPGPCHDMNAAVRELRWVADHGFVSVGVPGVVADSALPPLYDAHFDPFWAACQELGLVPSIHAGWGLEQGLFFRFADMMTGGQSIEQAARDGKFLAMGEELKKSRRSPNALGMQPRRAMWQLMLGGVFDRFPGLKLALTEIRAEWIPATLAYLDASVAESGVRIAHSPGEYFRRNCYVTPSSPKIEEIAMRHDIGVDRFIFGTDYPHPEGTWPNTREWLKTIFTGVEESEARMILGENAIDCYNLDRGKLLAIAERIGPLPDQILIRDYQPDAAMIADFDRRANFKVPPEEVDLAVLGELVSEDCRQLAG